MARGALCHRHLCAACKRAPWHGHSPAATARPANVVVVPVTVGVLRTHLPWRGGHQSSPAVAWSPAA
eukprot:10954248-Lingulodinium_polyedra.AAC.1